MLKYPSYIVNQCSRLNENCRPTGNEHDSFDENDVGYDPEIW